MNTGRMYYIRLSDFTGHSDRTALLIVNHGAVMFVIKKNPTVLKKLGDWLVKTNADSLTGKIDAPMLLIYDEVDNASINKKIAENPTRINSLIRNLLNVFSVSTYLN